MRESPLSGVNTSAAFWMLCRERREQMNKRRAAGVHYCVFCDTEYGSANVSGLTSRSHDHSKAHVANVLAAVERAEEQ